MFIGGLGVVFFNGVILGGPGEGRHGPEVVLVDSWVGLGSRGAFGWF